MLAGEHGITQNKDNILKHFVKQKSFHLLFIQISPPTAQTSKILPNIPLNKYC